MKDTTPEIEAELVTLFARRSNSERLRMVSEMFDLARALLIADIRRQEPDISDGDLRLRLFDRLYAADLANDDRLALRASLSGGAPASR